MGYVIVWALLNPEKDAAARSPHAVQAEAAAIGEADACLLLIAAVFLSLILGFATATECAAWGVTGALLLAWWSRTLDGEAFVESMMSATRLTCMIMLILAGAAFTTAAMAYTGIPAALAEWVKGQDLIAPHARPALTIMYIILGCLIDGISMIVLTGGRSCCRWSSRRVSTWSGSASILIIHVEMAQITPPVGFNLFVLQNMSGKDTMTIARAAFPFFFLLNVAVVDHHDIPANRALLAEARLPRLRRDTS